MITIIDYGCGNPASIKNMLKKLGHKSEISSNVKDIEHASKLILPGVGSFDHGMENLTKLGLIDVLNYQVLQKNTPILGICLGLQLFCTRSDEGGLSGLGWVDAEVIRFDPNKLGAFDKIPHMGWAELKSSKKSNILEGFNDIPRFYFVHSFHLSCKQEEDILASTTHGYQFTAAIEKRNIIGVQFHPEKSHKFGMKLLNNFVNSY